MKLVVKAQTDSGPKEFTYELNQPIVTLGRLKENDIQLPLSTVSGYHAQITTEGDEYYLMDRGSINGTFLNGQRLVAGEKKLLRDGDVIKIQNFEIFFSTTTLGVHFPEGGTIQLARQMVMEVLGSWQPGAEEKPRLIVMGGPSNGKQYELREDRPLVAGRTADCDIVIQHPSVSRKHAEISLTWGGAFIKDLNSANGVFINDERISGSEKLRDRDEIRLGQATNPEPITLVFSNPAEALLSKIEEVQITDSVPAALNAQEMAAAVQQEVARQEQASARETPAAEEPAVEQEQLPAIPGQEGVPEASSEMAVEPVIEDKRTISPLMIGGIVLLTLTFLGLILLFLPRSKAIEANAEPRKGSTGDRIVITLDDRAEDVTEVIILQKPATILKREENKIEVELPEFNNLLTIETQTNILVQDEEETLAQIPFIVMMAPRIASVNPQSGSPGIEVVIKTNLAGSQGTVLFGDSTAIVKSRTEQQVVAVVPEVKQSIPAEGIKIPLSLRSGGKTVRHTTDFLLLPRPLIPLEHFELAFLAKPFGGNLGFNEYAVETNLGPLLLVVARDVYSTSRERAEAIAKQLNDARELFKSDPSTRVTLSRKDTEFEFFAETKSGLKQFLLRIFSDDALAYSKINQRTVELQDVANWWEMLLNTYYMVFVQMKGPEDTGILAVTGGSVFQQIHDFYLVGTDSGEKYFKKDLLTSLTPDQKGKLYSVGFSLPYRIASVEGKWHGAMENTLYPNISEKTLELALTFRQRSDGTLTGTAEMNWKILMGSSGGSFENVAYKKLGTFLINGNFRKNRSFPVEFSFVEKEGRRLHFVGRVEGDILKGKYTISSTGDQGEWTAQLVK